MVVIAKHKAVVERLKLDTIEGAKAFTGALVKNHRNHRDIWVIDTTDDKGEALRLFLKRNLKPYTKDGLLSVLKRGRCWSSSREEWENARALNAAGIRTASMVAYGEVCGLFREQFSFLLTEAACGQCALEHFLRECTDATKRRAVIVGLARFIAKMHDHGFASPDLFSRHIFVDVHGERPDFCLIDMARLNYRSNLNTRLRARDLSALHVTAPLAHVTTRERLLFLRHYGKRPPRPLIRAVLKRSRHLLTRRKFQSFYAGTPQNKAKSGEHSSDGGEAAAS